MWVEAVALLGIERQRANTRVCRLEIHVRAPFLRQLRKFRLLKHHAEEIIVYDGRLLQLGCQAVYLRAILSVQVSHVSDTGGGEQALAVFASHDQKHLSEDP